MASERSFIMVKPDGVSRGLIADIIKRFEQKGFKLVAMKFMKVWFAKKFQITGIISSYPCSHIKMKKISDAIKLDLGNFCDRNHRSKEFLIHKLCSELLTSSFKI